MVLQVLGKHQLYGKIKSVNFIKEGYSIWAILYQNKELQWNPKMLKPY